MIPDLLLGCLILDRRVIIARCLRLICLDLMRADFRFKSMVLFATCYIKVRKACHEGNCY